MVLRLRLIITQAIGLQAFGVLCKPCIQPLPHAHFAWFGVYTLIQLVGGGGQLHANLRLCFAIVALTNQLASSQITAGCYARFPGTVHTLPDAAESICSFSYLLSIVVRSSFYPGTIQYRTSGRIVKPL